MGWVVVVVGRDGGQVGRDWRPRVVAWGRRDVDKSDRMWDEDKSDRISSYMCKSCAHRP